MDRQQAIWLIKDHMEHHKIGEYPHILLGEALNMAIAALSPPNGWVSVEDTVPDPGERVLATDGIFVGEAYRSSANSWFRHTGFPWRDGVTGRTVRFWMPLPAPPTNEE